MPGTHPDGGTRDDSGGAHGMLHAAGPAYTREWALFCDYAAAIDQPALPTTLTALTGFLTQIPARETTRARRVSAIVAAHRNAGFLLQRPTDTPPTGQATDTESRWLDGRPDPGQMIAACPTRGWPHGFLGRRDAFLITLTHVLGLTHTQARHIAPTEISNHSPPQTDTDSAAADTLSIRAHVLPTTHDPRTCPACAVVRWLDILGVADGLGRGSARMHLAAAVAPTALSPHHHAFIGPPRWRRAAQLLPAIDRHGWIDDYQPLSTRSIHTRLTLATRHASGSDDTYTEPTAPEPYSTATPPGSPTRTRTLDEVLTLLDQVSDDADAVNRRIQALLADDTLQNR